MESGRSGGVGPLGYALRMTGRILPTLVALVVCAFPAVATAQTTDYPETPTTSTDTAPTPTPAPAEESGVAPDTAAGSAPVPATPAATGTAPSTLAYTGSDVWLLGALGLLAVAGGAVLLRSSRRRV